MPRFLITGATGQVGFELRRALAPLGEIIACGSRECDLSDATAIRRTVREVQPHVIVNAAAYTAVDKAESQPDLARAVNATAPGLLGEQAAACGALVVHYSTDYVFDGKKAGPYTETDQPRPLGLYGQTKLEGEQALASSGARYLIFRTSWVFGHHGKNFIKTILRLASERTELRIVADQRGAPTGSALLADATAHISASYLRGGGEAFPLGLYHLTASGETSWHELARHVVQRALDAGKQLAATPAAILPIPSAEYATPAARPLNSLLETRKLRETFSLNLPDWRAGVDHMLDAILAPGR